MKRSHLASRRTFTRYVGSALAGALLAPRAFAQDSDRMHRIGILSDYPEPIPQTPLYHPFWAALSDLGYVSARTSQSLHSTAGRVEPSAFAKWSANSSQRGRMFRRVSRAAG